MTFMKTFSFSFPARWAARASARLLASAFAAALAANAAAGPSNIAADLEETTISQLHYPLTDHAVRYPMPAGGLFSTAQDVAKFCQTCERR